MGWGVHPVVVISHPARAARKEIVEILDCANGGRAVMTSGCGSGVASTKSDAAPQDGTRHPDKLREVTARAPAGLVSLIVEQIVPGGLQFQITVIEIVQRSLRDSRLADDDVPQFPPLGTRYEARENPMHRLPFDARQLFDSVFGESHREERNHLANGRGGRAQVELLEERQFRSHR